MQESNLMLTRVILELYWFLSIYFGKNGRENQSSLKKSMLRLVPGASEEEFFGLTGMSPGKYWQGRTRREDLAALKINQTAKPFHRQCPVEVVEA